MKKSLVYKIQIKFIAISAVSLIILGSILNMVGVKFLKDQRKEVIEKETYPIFVQIPNYLRAQENSSLSNLQNIIDIVSSSAEINIIVTDNLGYTYAASSNESEDSESKLLGKVITNDEREYLKNGNVIEKTEKQKYVYMKPVFQDDYFGGVLIVKIPVDIMNKKIFNLMFIIWGCIFAGIVIIMIGIGHLTRTMIIKPINEVNKVARKIAIGEVDKRVSITNDDEIGDLAESFNIMAESLNKSDVNRKDFISNVSHELRSPITSIRGFVAGMIDGIMPKDKEKYYLNIVYDEVKRLSRLVDDLLDISTLDNANYTLNKAEIDIVGLIKMCLANKETKIVEKDLKVEVILEDDHQFVYADRDRIIQVLTNLIDNAIKYSNIREIIKIETKVKGKKLYVSIKNNGPQLSGEELIKIWDRFYKSDSSRTNKESTGLGLSIVRTILSRHGEDIWVKSNNGETEFTFTLTRV